MQIVDTLIPVIALVKQTLVAPLTPAAARPVVREPAPTRVAAPVVEPREGGTPFAPSPVALVSSQLEEVCPRVEVPGTPPLLSSLLDN
jgi:hypothetical protein